MWELPAFQQRMTFGFYPNAYGAGSAIQQIVLQAGNLLVTYNKKMGYGINRNPLFYMVGTRGFEPPTT